MLFSRKPSDCSFCRYSVVSRARARACVRERERDTSQPRPFPLPTVYRQIRSHSLCMAAGAPRTDRTRFGSVNCEDGPAVSPTLPWVLMASGSRAPTATSVYRDIRTVEPSGLNLGVAEKMAFKKKNRFYRRRNESGVRVYLTCVSCCTWFINLLIILCRLIS